MPLWLASTGFPCPEEAAFEADEIQIMEEVGGGKSMMIILKVCFVLLQGANMFITNGQMTAYNWFVEL